MHEPHRRTRSCLTAAEQKLWAEIAGCRLGVWFRRRVPIGRYIADFVAASVRLVMEVDGSIIDGSASRMRAEIAS